MEVGYKKLHPALPSPIGLNSRVNSKDKVTTVPVSHNKSTASLRRAGI